MNPLRRRIVPFLLAGLIAFLAVLIVIGQVGALFSDPSSGWDSRSVDVALAICGVIILIISALQFGIIPRIEFLPTPPLVINESRTELTIVDKEGHLAHAVKTQDFIAKIPNVRMMIERSMGADGEVRVVSYSCGDLEVSMDPLIIPPNERVELRFRFLIPPTPNVKYLRRFEYDLIDSFLKAREYFTMRITRKVEKLILVINLPKDRPLSKAWLRYSEQSVDMELDHVPANIELNAPPGSATQMKYTVRQPVLGSVHQIWWEW